MKKNLVTLGLTAVAAGACALSLASCGEVATLDNLNVCIASTPDHIDPALNSAVDGASYAVHLFSGLVRYVPTADGKGLELAPDLATSLPKPTTENGKTVYTFTLRDGIKFSDGTDITAQDFVYSWNRAASYSAGAATGLDADYGYMFEVIDGYDSMGDDAKAGDELKFLNVKALDNKTLKVTLPVDVPYFYELCAFPAYAVLKDANDWNKVDVKGIWAKKANIVTSGAYSLSTFEDGVKLVMTKRDDYWDAKNNTTKNITCVFSDDDSATYGQFMTGDLSLIQTFPLTMISELQKKPEFHVIGQLGTYYFCYNINSDCFKTATIPAGTSKQKAEEEIRTALNLLIDRKAIVENVTKAGQTPSTGFVGAGLTDPNGGEFVDHNGVNGDGKGYFGDANNYAANKAKALEMLGKYYTVTDGKVQGLSLDYLYNTGTGHQNVAEAIQAQFKAVGITLTCSNQDWAQFLNTRKDGNYDTARNGWLADYNDPISFLDMWVTSSGNNDCQLGKGASAAFTYELDLTGIKNYGKLSGSWADTYDKVINFIKTESDTNARYALMHKAEDLLISTGCIGSIYNYTDTYLQSTKLTNVYASPLGYKYFMWAQLEA